MNTGFLKEYNRHFIDASRIDLSDTEQLDLLQRKKNGGTVYQCLYDSIVREYWKDHKGFPLKEKFHSQGLLVCSIAIRRLAAMCDMGDQKVQQVLKIFEELGWIIKNNAHTIKGQTVYILGRWNEEKEYEEVLFRDTRRDEYIKVKGTKPKENDYSMYNYKELYHGDMSAYFGRP